MKQGGSNKERNQLLKIGAEFGNPDCKAHHFRSIYLRLPKRFLHNKKRIASQIVKQSEENYPESSTMLNLALSVCLDYSAITIPPENQNWLEKAGKYFDQLFGRAPELLGQKTIFSALGPEMPSEYANKNRGFNHSLFFEMLKLTNTFGGCFHDEEAKKQLAESNVNIWNRMMKRRNRVGPFERTPFQSFLVREVMERRAMTTSVSFTRIEFLQFLLENGEYFGATVEGLKLLCFPLSPHNESEVKKFILEAVSQLSKNNKSDKGHTIFGKNRFGIDKDIGNNEKIGWEELFQMLDCFEEIGKKDHNFVQELLEKNVITINLGLVFKKDNNIEKLQEFEKRFLDISSPFVSGNEDLEQQNKVIQKIQKLKTANERGNKKGAFSFGEKTGFFTKSSEEEIKKTKNLRRNSENDKKEGRENKENESSERNATIIPLAPSKPNYSRFIPTAKGRKSVVLTGSNNQENEGIKNNEGSKNNEEKQSLIKPGSRPSSSQSISLTNRGGEKSYKEVRKGSGGRSLV